VVFQGKKRVDISRLCPNPVTRRFEPHQPQMLTIEEEWMTSGAAARRSGIAFAWRLPGCPLQFSHHAKVGNVPDGLVRQDPDLNRHLARLGPTCPDKDGWRPWTGGKD
jgi:hypothetical protein